MANMDTTTTDPLWLRIIHINDVYELDNFPSLKTLIDENKNNGPHETIIILGGDFLGPSLLSSLDHGTSMVDCMNSVGITHVCIGNHECDVPVDAIAKRIHQSQFVWLNSNMQELNDKVIARHHHNIQKRTPEYDIITVQHPTNQSFSRNVALLGLLTNDPSLYRPGSFNDSYIAPIIPTTETLIDQLLQKKKNDNENDNENNDNDNSDNKNKNVDFIIPITHQSMEDDRSFAQHFGGAIFPLLLGGHDHIPYDEIVNGCHIYKTGYDAISAGIIDLQWNHNQEKQPTITNIQLIPTSQYSPNHSMIQRVKGHRKILNSLERAKLFRISSWTKVDTFVKCGVISKKDQNEYYNGNNGYIPFSTANNRLGPSTGTTAIATMFRMGMRCHCCLLNAGSVRANKIYDNIQEQPFFTWKNMKEELPFDTFLTVTALPGYVIEETITNSRQGQWLTPKVAKGGFLHTCNNIHYDNDTKKIISIMDEPYQPNKLYLTTHPIEFLNGIDNHVPLLEYVKGLSSKNNNNNKNNNKKQQGQQGQMLNELLHHEAARPGKLVLVELFSALCWLQMGSFAELDKDGDGYITREEIEQECKKLFTNDDNDGNNDDDDECNNDVVDLVVDNIMSVADMDDDGKIDPIEMMIVHYVATDLVDHVTTEREFQALQETAAHVLNLSVDHPKVLEMVQKVHDKLDVSRDGSLDRREIIAALGNVRRQSLLRIH